MPSEEIAAAAAGRQQTALGSPSQKKEFSAALLLKLKTRKYISAGWVEGRSAVRGRSVESFVLSR
jgi:hypothetical protein